MSTHKERKYTRFNPFIERIKNEIKRNGQACFRIINDRVKYIKVEILVKKLKELEFNFNMECAYMSL